MQRPRRNRRTVAIRSLVSETTLCPSDLVMPFFVLPGEKRREPLKSLPGIFSFSGDELLKEAKILHKRGIPAIALFPIVSQEKKDPLGQEALREMGTIPQTLKMLKKELPSLCVISDIALDPFTTHGHDGVLNTKGEVENDRSVEILAKMALLHASSGADFVAPSDMMDGRVRAIRTLLDQHAFHETGIISYTAKYSSALYAPYRNTLGSTLSFGDKKGYQMNPANVREALLEAALDVEEGADIIMVKPGLFYLDVIAKIRAMLTVPLCAFHVSGEYAMVMAAHEKGYLDAPSTFYEALLCMKRAGADFIISYAIPQILHHLS